MSDTPHLQPSSGDDDERRLQEMMRQMFGDQAADNPELAEAMRSMGLDRVDPAMLQMVQAKVQAMMSGGDDGPINMQLATDIARKTVAAEGDPSVKEATRANLRQVVDVANLWLDEVTDLPRSTAAAQAWSRAEWIEQTMPTWRKLVEPVAGGVGAAIQQATQQQLRDLGDGAELPPELGLPPGLDVSAMLSQMQPMMAKMSAAMFGMQMGQAVGALAGELVTGTEVCLPLVPDNAVVVLPANVSAFAEGLGIEPGEVHLYLAAREAARVRLFAGVPWLSPALIAAVQSYAGDIRIDAERIEEAMNGADMSNPEELQKALQGSLFTPEPSAEQRRALRQLERLLALVEGWVDVAARQATAPHLPNADALSEAVRRRRAAGGPAERLFSSLVGLELRPRLMREAAGLFEQVEQAEGMPARDALWSHPDKAPTADDLDDPQGYLQRRGAGAPAEPDEMDAALDALLSQGRAELDAETHDADATDADDPRDQGGPDDTDRPA